MWSQYELDKIGEKFKSLPEENLESFLPPNWIAAIDEKARANLRYVTCTMYYTLEHVLYIVYCVYKLYLRNWFLVPRHTQSRKTIRFTRLCSGKNMGEFLLELLDDIAFAGDIEISVNFSYLLQDKQGEITYVHASKVTFDIDYII